jgi:hypothetical protein
MGFRGSRVQIPASRPSYPDFQRLAQTLRCPNGGWDIPHKAYLFPCTKEEVRVGV